MANTLLIKNIGILQTPVGSFSHKGEKQGENVKMKDAALFIESGIIKEICENGKLPADAEKAETIIDAEGKLVTPGLVEGHTHLVFGGYRQNEIPMKLKGAGYLDILNAGGGILDTVRHTRQATFEELYDKSFDFLDEMMALGVTTCEAKSGYGLDMKNEMKMLQVVKALDENHPMDMVATFMGAHAVPEEYKDRADDYIELLCREVLPEVQKQGLAEFADVFCEDSVFDVSQSRKYLECAKDCGFGLKIHADEIEEIGGSQLAGEIGAISAEHLIAIGERGMASMAKAGTTAMLLPATSFYLGKDFAPARRMIELGIPVATASDFNPGSCPSLNLQFVMNLGYLKYKMTPEEVLTAVTINPACAIGRGDRVGTLEVGKQADAVIWDAPDMEMLCYRFGSNLAMQVIKKGILV
ncbi:imidazolonepropionase [Aminipila luticellarii]|uniref:Imidazolonepropionase n=1 Tax=Aminipila luticellarii TaxID=2507160 RepID=A0A410PSE6_9FIRM|nr:imidazolonepropionase [Aminipila luticellarii]QAT41815.1 imidazolonepropionase [Aminipila luticellarii]